MLITAVLSATALFVVVLTAAVKKQEARTCKGIAVKVDQETGIAFLSGKEIEAQINYLSGGTVLGKKLNRIDFKTLEAEVEKNPYVAHAEIFVDQAQQITTTIEQKRPILRVINKDGVSYYLDETNGRLPLCNNFTPHVIVAMGEVQTHQSPVRDSIVQNDLFQLTEFIRKDTFLNALVDQIYVRANGEMDLYPVTGYHTICFGKVDGEMQDKFDRLKIFYKEGLSKVGWDKYKAINLKFKGQVVCVKRDAPAV